MLSRRCGALSGFGLILILVVQGCGSSATVLSDVVSCSQSVAAYCAGRTTADCAPTWSAALGDTTTCSFPGYAHYAACGSFDTHLIVDVDSGTTSYYDAATGNLVAIRYAGNLQSCAAGPASITVPKVCPSGDATVSGPTCPDAAADAIAGQ